MDTYKRYWDDQYSQVLHSIQDAETNENFECIYTFLFQYDRADDYESHNCPAHIVEDFASEDTTVEG
jgi:hypothetical protein